MVILHEKTLEIDRDGGCFYAEYEPPRIVGDTGDNLIVWVSDDKSADAVVSACEGVAAASAPQRGVMKIPSHLVGRRVRTWAGFDTRTVECVVAAAGMLVEGSIFGPDPSTIPAAWVRTALDPTDHVVAEDRYVSEDGDLTDEWQYLTAGTDKDLSLKRLMSWQIQEEFRLYYELHPDEKPEEDEHDPGPDPGPSAWTWGNLRTIADDHPDPRHVVPGIAICGCISLLYAPPKAGKSRFTFGILAALEPDGPEFCGMKLDPARVLVFSEEPVLTLGARAREFGIPSSTLHVVNVEPAKRLKPDELAREIYRAYYAEGGNFDMIVIDTLSAFIAVDDFNDYAKVSAMMEPLRQMIAKLRIVALVFCHHQSKSSDSSGHSGVLGSQALSGACDQLIRLGRSPHGGGHTLTIGGRFASKFPFDEAINISISPNGIELAASDKVLAEDVVRLHLPDTVFTIRELVTLIGATSADAAPARVAISEVIHKMVEAGEVKKLSDSRGQIAATYQRSTGGA